MTRLPSHTASITIEQPALHVAALLAQPLNYPRWASGLASGLQPAADAPGWWIAQAPQGEARVRFTPANDLGVADHWVRLPDGSEVHVPLRVVPHGGDSSVSEVLLTLFRTAAMDDAQWQADAAWVARDLAALKQWAELGGGDGPAG